MSRIRPGNDFDDDPLDLVVKGIFYFLMPAGGVVIVAALVGYGLAQVLV